MFWSIITGTAQSCSGARACWDGYSSRYLISARQCQDLKQNPRYLRTRACSNSNCIGLSFWIPRTPLRTEYQDLEECPTLSLSLSISVTTVMMNLSWLLHMSVTISGQDRGLPSPLDTPLTAMLRPPHSYLFPGRATRRQRWTMRHCARATLITICRHALSPHLYLFLCMHRHLF